MTTTSKKTGPKGHHPSKQTRELVSVHATIGTDQETIAGLLDIDPKTLRKYYRKELDESTARANAAVGGALFNKAKGGDTTAMIFWMKTRARWSERSEIDHTSSDGSMSQKPTKIELVAPSGNDSDSDSA
jgi:hypothetical protein